MTRPPVSGSIQMKHARTILLTAAVECWPQHYETVL